MEFCFQGRFVTVEVAGGKHYSLPSLGCRRLGRIVRGNRGGTGLLSWGHSKSRAAAAFSITMAIALMTLALVTAGNWDGATAYSNVSQPHTAKAPPVLARLQRMIEVNWVTSPGLRPQP